MNLLAILAAAVLAASAVAGVQTMRLQSLRAEVAQEQAEQRAEVAQQRADQAEADRLHDRVATRRNQELDRATQTAVEADRRAAAATGSDVDRLRHALIATAQDRAASATSCADNRAAADRLAGALSACAGLVADGLRTGGALATQVTGLQAATRPETPTMKAAP